MAVIKASDGAIDFNRAYQRLGLANLPGKYYPREQEVLEPGLIDPSNIHVIIEFKAIGQAIFTKAQAVRRWYRDGAGHVRSEALSPERHRPLSYPKPP